MIILEIKFIVLFLLLTLYKYLSTQFDEDYVQVCITLYFTDMNIYNATGMAVWLSRKKKNGTEDTESK